MIKTNVLCTAVVAGALLGFQAHAAVTLRCDFADADNERKPMHYHWDVSNRISPTPKFNMPIGENPLITVVRPLGGKTRGGKKLITQDTYKWDGEKYYYDWAPLKSQINAVRARARVFQLLIDNPPWAFQRGIDFQGAEEIEVYGNAWPPNDPAAWSRYIQDMLKELINTYGKDQVEQWRFCIGREIGTRSHWRAGKLDFYEHYRNTADAVRSVLPAARIGTHFLGASSKHSFGPDFVRWCRQHNVPYDFVGVSYYPFYNRIHRVDPDHVYQVDFAPIKDIPEWNPAAALEIHEFALIMSMSARGNSFRKAPKPHQESFTVMLAKMMYEHDMTHVFRWGTGEHAVAEQAFLSMEGNMYYASSREGEPRSTGNMMDAVFARDTTDHQYNIMIYNYSADPEPRKPEPVKVVTTLPSPPGTEATYRIAAYRTGGLEWSDWKSRRTMNTDEQHHSMLELEIELSSFSFQKIELRAPEPSVTRDQPSRSRCPNLESAP